MRESGSLLDLGDLCDVPLGMTRDQQEPLVAVEIIEAGQWRKVIVQRVGGTPRRNPA